MNTIFTINIKEEPNQKGEYEWANSYVMLSPLPKGYDHKNWTIKFNDKSEGLLKFTLLAHNNMGYPMKISLFQTKENYENNKADRSYTMKIIKSTNLNLTLRSEENIDYSGTYKGSMYVTESQKKYPVTTTVTLKNEFEDGAMYKIETRNDETGSTYIKGE